MPHNPLADELTRVPGILGHVADWIEGTVPCPNRPLAFAAALSAVSLAMAGKVRLDGTGPEIRVLVVGDSGSGKTVALHRAQNLIDHAGLQHAHCGGFASVEAVRDRRGMAKPIFWCEEHFDLYDYRGKRGGAILERAFDNDGQPVIFHGQCTPEGFDKACHSSERFRAIADGSLILVATPRVIARDNRDFDHVPASLVEAIGRLQRIQEPVEVVTTPGAETVRARYGNGENADLRALADKLALIFAASECGPDDPKPQITRTAVEWAWRLIDAQPPRA